MMPDVEFFFIAFILVSFLVIATIPAWGDGEVGFWLSDHMWVTWLIIGLWALVFYVFSMLVGDEGLQVR